MHICQICSLYTEIVLVIVKPLTEWTVYKVFCHLFQCHLAFNVGDTLIECTRAILSVTTEESHVTCVHQILQLILIILYLYIGFPHLRVVLLVLQIKFTFLSHVADRETDIVKLSVFLIYRMHSQLCIAVYASVKGKNSGFMRVVGSGEKALLDENGAFSFGAVPPGDISLVFVDQEKPQARIDFFTAGSANGVAIPPLDMWSANKNWLTISDPRYYNGSFGGISVYVPEGFVVPEEPKPDTTKPEPETPIDTAENLAIQVELHMDGDALVYNNDMSVASNVNYVEGISGQGILLSDGQFIDLGYIDPCAGFTLAVWTKWNGFREVQNMGFQGGGYPGDSSQVPFQGGNYPGAYQGPYGAYQNVPYQTGTYQILVSQRSYWSDSTSRFQVQYDWTSRAITAVSNGLDLNTGYAWLVKADTEFGGMLPTNEWTFLTLVYKGGLLYFYVNAQLVSANVGVPFVPKDVVTPVPFRVGGSELPTDTWNGVLDEFRLESVARGEEWIRAQYEMYRAGHVSQHFPKK